MSGQLPGKASVAIGTDAVAIPASEAMNSLPCSQGRVEEGCEPQGELPAVTSTLSRLEPPPSPQPSGDGPMAFVGTRANGAQAVPPHPLQAGGGAKNHTATVAQATQPQTFAKPADGPGIGGAVFALILVVSLILGLGWLARRMPGVGRSSNNALRVVGSLALGPRDRVVVVEVGSTQLLLGVGQGGMTTLHTLSEPLPVAQPSHGTPNLQNFATPFAQLLQKHLGKKP